MVINIDSNLIADILLICLCMCFFGPVMDNIIIPIFEYISKVISKVASSLYKYCCSVVTWFRNLHWCYKWFFLGIFAVICFLFEWIEGLLAAYIWFGILCIDLWYKFCAGLEQKRKSKKK